MSNPRLGVAVIGFGWMGQAHSRSYARIPSLFPDRTFEPELVVCADNMPERGEEAVRSFGFKESTTDWREAVARDDVDVVTVCSPNMLHVDMCVAAAEAGKAIFCEKPVGGTPEQTAIIEAAAREAGVITGVVTTIDGRRWFGTPNNLSTMAGWARSPTTGAGSFPCTAVTHWACCRGGSNTMAPATA